MNLLLILILQSGLEYNNSLFFSGNFRSGASGEEYVYVADGRGISVFGKTEFDRYGGCILPGESVEIAYHGGKVFVGGSRGLVKLDTGQCFEAHPQVDMIHDIPLTALAVVGDTLWYADVDGFLYGKDLARNSNLTETPVKLEAPAERIVLHGSEIYLPSDTAGLFVIELGKKTMDAYRIQIEGDPEVMDIVLGDGVAWLACGDDSLWTVELKRRTARALSKSEASGQIRRLERFGERLAAAAGTGDFVLFSLKNPRNPEFLLKEPLDGLAAGLVGSGNYCFVFTGSSVVRMVIPDEGLSLGRVIWQSWGVGYDLAARVNIGVLALGSTGVKALDFTDSLAFLGSYRDPVDCRRVFLYGSEVYALTAGNVLYVADFKDPLRPAKRSYIQFQSVVSGLDADGEMLLVAEQERGLGSWWRCPCGPVKEQSRWTPGGRVTDVCIKGKLAYVSATPAMICVVDWSDSTNLEEVSRISVGRDYQRLFLIDNQLFALDSSGTLAIIDVSRPTRPVELSTLELSGTPQDLVKTDNRLFVASGSAGVHEIDISKPASPVILSTYEVTPARAVGVTDGQLLILTPHSIESYKIKP